MNTTTRISPTFAIEVYAPSMTWVACAGEESDGEPDSTTPPLTTDPDLAATFASCEEAEAEAKNLAARFPTNSFRATDLASAVNAQRINREALVEALSQDYANSLANDRSFRLKVARDGFDGFEAMNNAELCQSALEAGLNEHDEKADKAIVILGGADRDVAEWVGLHYRKNFDAESRDQRHEWRLRFLESTSDDHTDEPRPSSR